MTAYKFAPGFGPLPTGEQLNSLAGSTGATGPTGPTGPAFSTASPTFTGTTTVAALTSSGVVKMASLPTADPHVVGQLFLTGTALQVSAG